MLSVFKLSNIHSTLSCILGLCSVLPRLCKSDIDGFFPLILVSVPDFCSEVAV